jgi:hypothetical protein
MQGFALIQAILSITVPVFSIVAIGYLYGKFNGTNLEALNKANISVFVPALLLYFLAEKLPALASAGNIAVATAIIILLPGLLVYPLAPVLKIPRKALLPAIMFNNSGNLGLPLAALAFGQEHLALSIIAFVVATTLHFSVGLWYLTGSFNPKQLLLNPVFLATAIGLCMNLLGWHFPALIKPGLEMLSQVTVPLMLVALGVRLVDINWQHWRIGLIAAILSPITGLIAAYLAVELLGITGIHRNILLLFGVLPPAIMNFLLAERYQLYPLEVAAMVAFANVGTLISVPLLLAFIL